MRDIMHMLSIAKNLSSIMSLLLLMAPYDIETPHQMQGDFSQIVIKNEKLTTQLIE